VTAFQTALLVALFVVAAVHTKSRVAGAFAAATWVMGAVVYGAVEFQTRHSLAFLGIETPAWLYFAFMGGLFLWNATVIARALRRRRSTTSKPA
jgi:hypothetical protein